MIKHVLFVNDCKVLTIHGEGKLKGPQCCVVKNTPQSVGTKQLNENALSGS